MDEEWGLHRVLLEYGKNVQLQSRKLNKRIESNGIQSVLFCPYGFSSFIDVALLFH
jgi:hypothetical protein